MKQSDCPAYKKLLKDLNLLNLKSSKKPSTKPKKKKKKATKPR